MKFLNLGQRDPDIERLEAANRELESLSGIDLISQGYSRLDELQKNLEQLQSQNREKDRMIESLKDKFHEANSRLQDYGEKTRAFLQSKIPKAEEGSVMIETEVIKDVSDLKQQILRIQGMFIELEFVRGWMKGRPRNQHDLLERRQIELYQFFKDQHSDRIRGCRLRKMLYDILFEKILDKHCFGLERSNKLLEFYLDEAEGILASSEKKMSGQWSMKSLEVWS